MFAACAECTKRGFILLVGMSCVADLLAQTTLDLDEFNSAYFEYGTYKDSNPQLARQAAGRAYELGRQLFGAENERTAMLAINYGILFQDEAETQRHLDDAVMIYQSIFGFASAAMIDPLMRLGRTLSDAERYGLAATYYGRALQLAESELGATASRSGALQMELGSLALKTGDREQALLRLTRARSILETHSDPGSLSNLTVTNLLLGDYYLVSQQFEAALAPLLEALDALSRYPNSDVTQRNRIALITAYENLGRRDDATVQCLAIGVNRRIPENVNLSPLYSVLPDQESLSSGTGDSGVAVQFTVDAEGFVRDPVLLGEVGGEAQRASFLAAISRFRFAPRFVDGQAVESPAQQYIFRY